MDQPRMDLELLARQSTRKFLKDYKHLRPQYQEQDFLGPAYLAVWRAQQRAEGQLSPGAYLRVTAYRACLMHLREEMAGGLRGDWQRRGHGRQLLPLPEDGEVQQRGLQDRRFQQIEDREEAELYLQGLADETSREVLILLTMYDMRPAEVAEFMQRPVQWVYNLRVRSTKKIRNWVVRTQAWQLCYDARQQEEMRRSWGAYDTAHWKNNRGNYVKIQVREDSLYDQYRGLEQAYRSVEAKIARRSVRSKMR